MAVSTIGVADADTPDKYLHTYQRTISGTAREDQFVLPGQPVYPTYCVSAIGVSIATTADHVLQIMGDGTNYSRLQRLIISVTEDVPAAATVASFSIYRLSSAGSGGTSRTAVAFDSSDTYAGAAMSLPTSKGTEGAQLWIGRLSWQATAGGVISDRLVWQALPGMKPIIFGTSTANGIAVKVTSGIASCSIDYTAEFITTSYL